MDKFVIRTKRARVETQSSNAQETHQNQNPTHSPMEVIEEDIPIVNNDVDSDQIIADPGLRPSMSVIGFNSVERERIRRAYLTKGPCQPRLINYPVTLFSGKPHKFNPDWSGEFHDWLEYSESKDAVFCLFCYFFNIELGDHRFNHDSFVREGFRNWKKKDRLKKHIDEHHSSHRKCKKACEDLLKQKQHVDIMIAGISAQAKANYRTRLNASMECVRLLLMQALPFRGHDESEDSKNQGNFLALLKFLCKHNDEINGVSLKNAPENNKLTSPTIQKDICNAASFLVTRAIVEDIGGDFSFFFYT